MTPALLGLHCDPVKGAAFPSGAPVIFDRHGAHACQHPGTEAEIRALVRPLQPAPACVSSLAHCFERPQPTGIALRLRR